MLEPTEISEEEEEEEEMLSKVAAGKASTDEKSNDDKRNKTDVCETNNITNNNSHFVDILDVSSSSEETNNNNNNNTIGLNDTTEYDDPLSWRMDPETSFSDWTIIIIECSKDNNNMKEEEKNNNASSSSTTSTYHVHKSILSVGPCKSDYFLRLFQQQQHSNNKNKNEMKEFLTNTSRIELEEAAAKEFPTLLDFFYSRDASVVDIQTDNATALRYLAQYFGIRKLFSMATLFIRDDLNSDTAQHYLRHGAKFHDETLTSRAADICAKHIDTYDSSDLVSNLTLDLFAKIVSSEQLCSNNKRAMDEQLCKTIAQFCLQHSQELDCHLLAQITSPMTRVSKDVSLYLYSLSLELEQKEERETKKKTNATTTSSDDDDVHEALESLRRRCMDASSTCWRNVVINQIQGVAEKKFGKNKKDNDESEKKKDNDDSTKDAEAKAATTTTGTITSSDQQQQQQQEQNTLLLFPSLTTTTTTTLSATTTSLETATKVSYSNMPTMAKIELLEKSLMVANKQMNAFLEGTLDGTNHFRCPKRSHFLKLSRVYNLFTCDICQMKYPKGTPMFGCRKCNFDMCTDCGTQRLHYDTLSEDRSLLLQYDV